MKLQNGYIKQYPKDSSFKWSYVELGSLYSARENIHYDYPDFQIRVLDWWATTPGIMAQSMKDCPALPSYVHANIGETSCMLVVRPDLINM